MSLLQRFRKPGGFQQLVALIETCEPAKQKNLLHLVATEDPGWAHLVRLKAITLDRVLSWPVEVLMEITPSLPDKCLATVYQVAETASVAGSPQLHDKWIHSLPSMKAKEVRDLSMSHRFTGPEQIAANIKVIQTVRELEAKGLLRFSSFDPILEIDTRIAA